MNYLFCINQSSQQTSLSFILVIDLCTGRSIFARLSLISVRDTESEIWKVCRHFLSDFSSTVLAVRSFVLTSNHSVFSAVVERFSFHANLFFFSGSFQGQGRAKWRSGRRAMRAWRPSSRGWAPRADLAPRRRTSGPAPRSAPNNSPDSRSGGSFVFDWFRRIKFVLQSECLLTRPKILHWVLVWL